MDLLKYLGLILRFSFQMRPTLKCGVINNLKGFLMVLLNMSNELVISMITLFALTTPVPSIVNIYKKQISTLCSSAVFHGPSYSHWNCLTCHSICTCKASLQSEFSYEQANCFSLQKTYHTVSIRTFLIFHGQPLCAFLGIRSF